MIMSKIKLIIFVGILALYLAGCAPSLMKAKMAMRDHRYDLALDYALSHLRKNPGDPSARRLVEQSARHYFDHKKAEIERLEQFEYWDKMVDVSTETAQKMAQLSETAGLNYPTKQEMDFLHSKTAYSNQRQADALYQQGRQYFDNGDYDQALATFLQTKEYVATYKDIDLRLTQTRQKLAEVSYQSGLNFFNRQEYALAVEQFEKTLEFNPDFSDAQNYIQQSKSALAQAAYQQGRLAMQQKDYSQALSKFKESQQYQPNYQDVDFQIQRASFELAQSLFRQAEQMETSGDLRQAMFKLQEGLQYQPENQKAREKFQLLHNKLTIRLAVLPFHPSKIEAEFGALTTEFILSALATNQSDFFELVDREHLQEILQEQALAQSGIIDESKAVEVGKLVGVNHIMPGKVTLVSSKFIPAIPTVKTAYYKRNYLDRKGVKRTKKEPFNYTEYESKRTVVVSLSYHLIDVETSQIIDHQTFTSTQEDVATWVVCSKHRVNDLPGSAKSRLNASKIPKSQNQLINEALRQLTQQVASRITSIPAKN